jgi:hypothetical protein
MKRLLVEALHLVPRVDTKIVDPADLVKILVRIEANLRIGFAKTHAYSRLNCF